ncbi:lysophospholipid acyltransferase 2-like [Mercenaria mercenaria]|uniref:lysophospholipid acyltransferase 2-like n=1 Tax=Mercenaria mercenaria TaxID=6596 RepID=UPI00234EE3D4|nr:lysophospholipid acyltransferase 2-like [Mercenaria mercenaria]
MDVKEDGILGPVANKIGVPTDMKFHDNSMELERALIFFGGEAICLLCSILYYKYLPPSKVDATVRHIVAMNIGFTVGYFSFGMQFNHVVAQSLLCYTAMLLLPQSVMHIVVFGLALSYLVLLHLYRAYMIPEDVLYSIDVSGPLMITTEKISSLACSIYDGRHGNKDKLSDLQKRYMISKPPSALEYFSYLFYFQGVVVGPLSFYRDYIAYVNGSDISKKPEKNGVQNNNEYAGSQKLSPFSDPEFIRKHSFPFRFWYMIFSMLCCRAKYYVAFSLGDAICNASGFGFNGYDTKGQPKWNLVTNVNAIQGHHDPLVMFQGATSPKLYIDNWNIQTAVWLRLVCYDRIPVMKKLATFLLSAMWHGCYPGYYFTFMFAAPISESARQARKKIRPYFQGSRSLQIFYDILTWIGTHIIISYMVVPFTILHLRQTLTFYTYSMYWCLHIVIAVSFVILPYIPAATSACKTSRKTDILVDTHHVDGVVDGKLLHDGVAHKQTDSNRIKKD